MTDPIQGFKLLTWDPAPLFDGAGEMLRVIRFCESNAGVLELWSDAFPTLQHSMTPTASFTLGDDAGYPWRSVTKAVL
jgi:hypothetical protein